MKHLPRWKRYSILKTQNLLEECSRYMSSSAVLTMTERSANEIKDIKQENDRLIMKFFGLENLILENQDAS